MTANQIRFQEHKETNRHNRATEHLERKKLDEVIRHNIVGEQETGRHNLVVEDETVRHNIATEHLTAESTAVQNAHYVRMDAENRRHNIATEGITSEYNQGVISNQKYSNETNRVTGYGNLDVSRDLATSTISLNEQRELDLQSQIERRADQTYLDTQRTAADVTNTNSATALNYVKTAQGIASLIGPFDKFFGTQKTNTAPQIKSSKSSKTKPKTGKK